MEDMEPCPQPDGHPQGFFRRPDAGFTAADERMGGEGDLLAILCFRPRNAFPDQAFVFRVDQDFGIGDAENLFQRFFPVDQHVPG